MKKSRFLNLPAIVLMAGISGLAGADEDSGTLAIALSWNGAATEAVSTAPRARVERGWAPSRAIDRARASISATWPVIVRGESKDLTITLLYDVTPEKLYDWNALLGAWLGSPRALYCPSGRDDCHSVDLEKGEATFRDAIVKEIPEEGIPGLRITGVWKFRVHLNASGTVLKPPPN